jgi:hypothetical protein
MGSASNACSVLLPQRASAVLALSLVATVIAGCGDDYDAISGGTGAHSRAHAGTGGGAMDGGAVVRASTGMTVAVVQQHDAAVVLGGHVSRGWDAAPDAIAHSADGADSGAPDTDGGKGDSTHPQIAMCDAGLATAELCDGVGFIFWGTPLNAPPTAPWPPYWGELSSIERCTTYYHERVLYEEDAGSASGVSCERPIACTGSDSVNDIIKATDNPDVWGYFIEQPPPIPGQVFEVLIGSPGDTNWVHVGADCPDNYFCRPITPAVKALVDLLFAIDNEQLRLAPCAGKFPRP